MSLKLLDSLYLWDWLYQRGLSWEECTDVLTDISSGDMFVKAMIKVTEKRKLKLEKNNER